MEIQIILIMRMNDRLKTLVFQKKKFSCVQVTINLHNPIHLEKLVSLDVELWKMRMNEIYVCLIFNELIKIIQILLLLVLYAFLDMR